MRESGAVGADESLRPPVAIDRLCDELCNQAEALGQTIIRVGHRAIARTIGCSAARIPALMQRLEDRGDIIRTPFKNTYLIDVTPLIDQPPTPLIDQGAAPLIDQPSHDRASAQQDAPETPCNRDRVKTAYKVHESQTQEEELARPLFDHLLSEPSMNRTLAERIARHPIGTVTDFAADLRIAQTFAKRPFYFTVARWRDGQRVIAPEEPRDERPAARSSSTGTRRRAAPNRSEHAADPATDAEYRAYLAECLAAPKATPADFPGLPVPGQRGAAYGS